MVGSFAAQAENWRWPFLELLWLSGATFLVLFFFLPETLESTVLVRRAERLRKLTGNPLLKAPAEVEAVEGESFLQSLKVTTARAFRLSLEPSLAMCHLYIACVYGIFYLCEFLVEPGRKQNADFPEDAAQGSRLSRSSSRRCTASVSAWPACRSSASSSRLP